MTGDIKTLAEELKRRGCVTTLTVIGSLIERQEAGEDIDLNTNGYANFFFVEDNGGGVSVVYADRRDGQWDVDVYRFDYDRVWNAGHRFFFRNSDTGSL